MAQDALRFEFDAEDGSFMAKLRSELEWDREAFGKLLLQMYESAIDNQNTKKLDRWIAEGFWYLESFVPIWSQHANFPRVYSDAYYTEAYKLLNDLAYFLFRGESPYEHEDTLLKKIQTFLAADPNG